MPDLDENTRLLVERLLTRLAARRSMGERLRRWLTAADDDFASLVRLVAELGASRQPGVLPLLVELLFEGRPLANEAARAVATIIDALPLGEREELVTRALRTHRDVMLSHSRMHFLTLRPADAQRMTRLDEGWAVLALASVHSSGYVREAAVRALDALDERRSRDLPFLLARANDWVPEVRGAALRALRRRIAQRRYAAFARCLPLVVALRERRRADHEALVGEVLALLATEEARPALVEASSSPEPSVRRAATRLLLADDTPSRETLERALADGDLVVRGLAVDALPRLLDGELRRELLDRALADAPPVRRRAATQLAQEPPDWLRARIDRLLADPSTGVRLAAAPIARALGVDVAASLRGTVRARPSAALVRGALAGLAADGDEDDALLLLERAEEETSARTRATALQALASLDRESVEPFTAALKDARRVSRVAARVLAGRRRPPHLAEQLLALAAGTVGDRAMHVVEGALHVVDGEPPWRRLALLLEATRSSNVALATAAGARIDAHTMIAPTLDEVALVEQRLATARLDAERRRAVEFELDQWRRR